MPKLAQNVLKSSGMRVTNQRALIMEVIRQGHLDADEIYRRARQKEPRLSLSTVYRTLQALKERGLVAEIHLDKSHRHYEVQPPKGHHHLVCLGCGRVVEFRYPLSSLVKKNVPEARGFSITETEIRIAGYCAECRRKWQEAAGR